MANLVGRPRKERDIVKLLYEENKEYSKVMAFVKNHMKENNGCKGFASKEIMITLHNRQVDESRQTKTYE